MILDHVWEVGFETASNPVDVYVGYLRRKIDRPGDMPLLHTIRGAGYVLAADSTSSAESRAGGHRQVA
jgi:two-component system, OmpR family, response regulator